MGLTGVQPKGTQKDAKGLDLKPLLAVPAFPIDPEPVQSQPKKRKKKSNLVVEGGAVGFMAVGSKIGRRFMYATAALALTVKANGL